VSRRAKLVLAAAVAIGLLVGGTVWYLGPLAPVATGYAAHNACAGQLLAERPAASVAAELPSNPLVPLLDTSVDPDRRTATSSLLGLGLWGSTAYHTPGLGCTVAHDDPGFAPLDPLPPPDPDARWPDGAMPGPVPSDVDLDALDAALDAAFAEDADADKNTRAVVVVHDGRIVAERYADGFTPDTPQLGWSMTKSIGSAIVGRLVDEGRLSLDDSGLWPAWESGDPRSDITVEHLLHMTDGLAFDEVYEAGAGVTLMLFRPRDTAEYAATQPLEAPPGTRWEYSSGTTALLCDVATRAYGHGPSLARELVFDPLGMSTAVIEPDVTGTPICSSYGYASPRDWARFGLWYLEDGVWDDVRLLPEGWVEYSTTPVDLDTDNPYGAQWWLNEGSDGALRYPDAPPDMFLASGHDGQKVAVVPSEDLVIVRMGFTPDLDDVGWGFERLVADVVAALG
jgi:CubicO group peptidase (beta-lactamase class C family)